MSIRPTIKILHEAEGHIITCETVDGESFRGKLVEAEDSMNIQMSNVTVTHRDGSISGMNSCFIRGSKVLFISMPDILRHAPVFTSTSANKSGQDSFKRDQHLRNTSQSTKRRGPARGSTTIHKMAFLNVDMSPILTQDHVDTLQNAGFWTINDLCSSELMDIKRKTNIKFHILIDLMENIKKRYTLACHDLGFMVEKSIRECKMCPTGLPELTFALDGGYQTQEIVEFCGDSESGKSEMCYLLCGEILSHFDDFNILYVASNHDFDQEKVIKYVKSKAGNKLMDEDDLFKALSRVEIARPTKFSQLTHLFNSLVHTDKKNLVKCIIIDSLSFIIQDDILDIKTTDLGDGNEFKRFSGFLNKTSHQDILPNDIIEVYLREVMRLLTNVAQTRNVIVVITNSDPNLDNRKSWTNAIDHKIHLSKMHDSSIYKIHNSKAHVCRATIMKTIHNIGKIGHTIPFTIDDDGIFAIRTSALKVEHKEECSQDSDD